MLYCPCSMGAVVRTADDVLSCTTVTTCTSSVWRHHGRMPTAVMVPALHASVPCISTSAAVLYQHRCGHSVPWYLWPTLLRSVQCLGPSQVCSLVIMHTRSATWNPTRASHGPLCCSRALPCRTRREGPLSLHCRGHHAHNTHIYMCVRCAERIRRAHNTYMCCVLPFPVRLMGLDPLLPLPADAVLSL